MKEKTKKAIHKCLSLMLAAAMLLAISGIPVLAEETTTGQEDIQEIIPENPVHHCVKEDTTDWSYVYFGSYPQTEVTGAALTIAITGAAYDENGDAEVGGIKYRRISKDDTNQGGYFGDSTYRYFKWEKIRWRVLQKNNETLFVVADKGLDCKNYNDKHTSITWENCTLREWLNSKFYNTAFSSAEQGAIVKQSLVNEDHPDYGTEGGNDTTDNIFVLSTGEVTKSEYGFCEDYSAYSASRWVQASDYAHTMGAGINTSGSYEGNCGWWLRSPGSSATQAAYVGVSGDRSEYGSNVYHFKSYACVPALRINLSSDLWYPADDGSSGDGENSGTEDIANPVHHCVKENTNWSYVYFGSYPQSEVTGSALTTAITGAAYDENGDAWVGDTKYRRISKSDTNNDMYFGDNNYRYFKWGPIRWRVLKNDGSTLFVVADKGLDCKTYNETNASITWEKCTLRNWINSEFYSQAFSSEEQEAIVEQTIMNEDNYEHGTEGGNDTTDKIFLLSIGEVTNPENGFCEYDSAYSASRQVKVSGYTRAMGSYAWRNSSTGGNINCNWLLRSPGFARDSVAHVSFDGSIHSIYDNNYVDFANYAVVPALHINLTSDLWFPADDGSSDEDYVNLETKRPTDPGTEQPTKPGTDKPTDPGTNRPTDSGANTNTNTATTTKTSLAKATVTLSANTYNYDGKTKKPAVKSVKLAGKTLKSGTDYTVSYKNNKNIGTATVTITGKGNYTGSAKKTFKITAKKGSTFTVGSNKYKITGSSTVAFSGLKSSNTKKVTIPKTVKIGGKNFKVTSIAANALKNKKVTQITVGNNVKTIGKNAFYKCTKLTKVTLGSAVTSIGDNAFYGCSSLKNITLPSKVTTIGKGTFTNCKKLGTITIKSTKLKKVGKNAFKGIKSTAKIKVPAKKLSAYKKLLKGKGQGSKVKITK